MFVDATVAAYGFKAHYCLYLDVRQQLITQKTAEFDKVKNVEKQAVLIQCNHNVSKTTITVGVIA